MVMELMFDGENYNPVDYNSYDEFWDDLPKEGDFVEFYEFDNDFLNVSGLDLDTPRTKEELEDVFEFVYKLNTTYEDEEEQEMIISGIVSVRPNDSWEILANNFDNITSQIEEKFVAFTYDESDIIDSYLRDQGLTSFQIGSIINYIDGEQLIEDNFVTNNYHYYIQ